jgi:hypothetical protein
MIGPSRLIWGFKRTPYYTLSIQKCLVILGLNATLCDYGTNTLMATESLEKNSENLWLASLLNYRSGLQWEEKLAPNLFDIARSRS